MDWFILYLVFYLLAIIFCTVMVAGAVYARESWLISVDEITNPEAENRFENIGTASFVVLLYLVLVIIVTLFLRKRLNNSTVFSYILVALGAGILALLITTILTFVYYDESELDQSYKFIAWFNTGALLASTITVVWFYFYHRNKIMNT
jgi:hypothetical protein